MVDRPVSWFSFSRVPVFGLRHEVVDTERGVVHADLVRGLGNLQVNLDDLFRRRPPLAAEGVVPEA